ncbi:hypothetical protein GGR56DRAFT_547120 [Xylariaceae sp. FL0804]|nr:hypothetical protein GGR56DRAFT_547120 [Xylariaceae sp. FL0804]
MSSNGPSGGFSLFPNPNITKTPPRKTTPRPRATTPQSSPQRRGPSLEIKTRMSTPPPPPPPPNGRHPPEGDMAEFVIDGSPSPPRANEPHQMAPNNPWYASRAGPSQEPRQQQQQPPSEVPPRTDTAFSGASTLVRSPSVKSRSSIAKRPLVDEEPAQSFGSPPPPAPEQPIRSIFPQYDHSLPFDRQEYYPTQTSPTHIPRQVISRQSHVPPQQAEPAVRSPVRSPPLRSPHALNSADSTMSGGGGGGMPRFGARQHYEPAPIPPVSTPDDLRDYWKAASGWKAGSADGRVFCLRLVLPERDAPVYSLAASSGQPLYHLRVDPTSASARVALSRHDPAKTCREPDPHATTQPRRSTTGLRAALREAQAQEVGEDHHSYTSPSLARGWQEALTTTLEEPSRRLPGPHGDGLVALLYPTAAARMALDRPFDEGAVAAAERECARLVWDADSANYFLAHPAVAAPFCVTVERAPAYSRVEYTVEHVESPQPLARLTRDAAGEGWLEADTLVAGRVDAHYVLDVAVAALLLVARLDEPNVLVEQFAPPPPALLRGSSGGGGGRGSAASFLPPPTEEARRGGGSRLSGMLSGRGSRASKRDEENGKKKNKKRRRISELELDLESQASSLGGKLDIKDKDRDKLPSTTRTAIKLLGFAFKCVIWALTLVFKAFLAVVVGLTKCLTSEKF